MGMKKGFIQFRTSEKTCITSQHEEYEENAVTLINFIF